MNGSRWDNNGALGTGGNPLGRDKPYVRNQCSMLYPWANWQSLTCSAFPTLLKYNIRNINNHMAHWKVIALINGDIEAVSGPAAQDRPGAHEWIVWEGEAADKAEALKCAEKADPRVDLEWMRIRYERDLEIR
jgi:hypothetical protein